MSSPPLLLAPTHDRKDVVPPGFACSWTASGLDAAWVHASGALDIATTPHLELTLSAPLLQARLVVLDLRELVFMDSSGLHLIVDASIRARANGSRLLILRGPPEVDRMFTLTGTAADVEIADIAPMAPPVQVLLQLAEAEAAGGCEAAVRAQQDTDQSAADLDQTQADADQSASDDDQVHSDSDQALADRDQHASDREQAAADAEPDISSAHAVAREERAAASQERESTTAGRAQGTARRLAIAARRDEIAQTRDRVAEARDLTARARDEAAGRRDEAALAREPMVTETGDLQEALTALRALRESEESLRRDSELQRVRAARDRASAAVDRKQAAADRLQAGLDELTGVFRRGTGELALAHEIDRSRRSGLPMVLAMIDVDGLEAVNDTQGHAAGDLLLRDVAAAISSTMRSYDVTVRWGGDEFLCALSNLTLAVAQERIADIAGALAAHRPAATVSAGLAQLDDDTSPPDDDDTLAALIVRADADLAKAKGRRRAQSTEGP